MITASEKLYDLYLEFQNFSPGTGGTVGDAWATVFKTNYGTPEYFSGISRLSKLCGFVKKEIKNTASIKQESKERYINLVDRIEQSYNRFVHSSFGDQRRDIYNDSLRDSLDSLASMMNGRTEGAFSDAKHLQEVSELVTQIRDRALSEIQDEELKRRLRQAFDSLIDELNRMKAASVSDIREVLLGGSMRLWFESSQLKKGALWFVGAVAFLAITVQQLDATVQSIENLEKKVLPFIQAD